MVEDRGEGDDIDRYKGDSPFEEVDDYGAGGLLGWAAGRGYHVVGGVTDLQGGWGTYASLSFFRWCGW